MMELFYREALHTGFDLLPILLILGLFAARFMARNRALLLRTLTGILLVGIGLTLFRIGLDGTLLPLATDLASGLAQRVAETRSWPDKLSLVGFAVAIGATAAMIEPTIVATADRVHDLTGGSVRPMVLRLAVGVGFGLGLGFGGFRLVFGLPLGVILAPLVGAMIVLSFMAPRRLVPLALDSGAIATSVITVPIIAAYGVAVADTLPDRNPLADGFGMLVLAMVGSAVSVLATATVDKRLLQWRLKRKESGEGDA